MNIDNKCCSSINKSKTLEAWKKAEHIILTGIVDLEGGKIIGYGGQGDDGFVKAAWSGKG